MSLVAHYGFDSFGGAPWNGAANPNYPKQGAGIYGTPYEQDLLITLGTATEAATRYNSAGVTGLDANKIGVGAERRNLLTLCRTGGSGTSYLATARLSAQRNITAAQSYRRVTGFTFIDQSTSEPTAAYNMINHRRGTSVSGIVVRRPNSQWSLGSSTVAFERNRPYYIELVEYMTAVSSGSGAIMMEIWIDGELAVPAYGYSSLPFGSVYATNVEVVAGNNTLQETVILGVADIYITDELGEAPANGRMGPQMVLPMRPSAVRAPNWEVINAPDAKTALSDDSDTTSVRSPLGKSSLEADFDMNLAPGSVVNGIAVFQRGRRDPGAPRMVSTKIARTVDQVQLAAGNAAALAAGFTGTLGARTPLVTAADRAQLVFPDSGKITCTLTTE